MKKALIFGAIVVLAAASQVSAQDKAKGEAVYAAQKCSLCHAVAGKGNAKGALDDVGNKLKADELRMWVVDPKAMTAKTGATRKPEMKAYNLPKEDLDNLVAYMASLKK